MSGRCPQKACAHQRWYASRAWVQYRKLTGIHVVQRPGWTGKKNSNKISKLRISISSWLVKDPCLLSSSPGKYLPLAARREARQKHKAPKQSWRWGEVVVGRGLWTLLCEMTVEPPETIRRPEGFWKHWLSCPLCPVSPKSPPPQCCGASLEDYPPTGPEETRGLHRSPRSSVLRVFLERMLIRISLTKWRSNWAIISKYLRKHRDENPPNPQKATYTLYRRKKKKKNSRKQTKS